MYNAVIRYRDDWTDGGVLQFYTYNKNNSSNGQLEGQAGIIKSKPGGTKLVIEKNGSQWKIIYKTNYNAIGELGPYIGNGHVTNKEYFYNYGAY